MEASGITRRWGMCCNVSQLEADRQIAGYWLPSRNDPALNREATRAALGLRDRSLGASYRGSDFLRDIVLHREQIIDRPIVAFRPDVAAGAGFDELGGHTNPFAYRLDAALKNVFHAEVATNLADVDRLALIDLGGIASDDD